MVGYTPKGQPQPGYFGRIKNAYNAKKDAKLKAELQSAYKENATKLEEAFDKGFRASITAIECYKKDMVAEDEKLRYNEANALELEEKQKTEQAVPFWNAVIEAETSKGSLENLVRNFKTMSEKIRHARNKVMQKDYGSTEDIMSALQYLKEYGDMLGIQADDKLMALLSKVQQQEGIDVVVSTQGAYTSSHVLSPEAVKRREAALKSAAAKKTAYQGNAQHIDQEIKDMEQSFANAAPPAAQA